MLLTSYAEGEKNPARKNKEKFDAWPKPREIAVTTAVKTLTGVSV
jgi:hypothetical protein